MESNLYKIGSIISIILVLCGSFSSSIFVKSTIAMQYLITQKNRELNRKYESSLK